MKSDHLMHCEECGREIRHGYESVHVTESHGSPGRLLCNECHNRETAAYVGIDFIHQNFSSVELDDAEGNKHLFNFATRMSQMILRCGGGSIGTMIQMVDYPWS